MEKSIVIIKTDRKDLFNVECLWPGVGDITLSEVGEASVDREGAKILIEGHPHFYIVGEEAIKPKAHVDELNDNKAEDDLSGSKEENEEIKNEGVEEGDSIDIEAYKAALETKTRKELEDLCKPFPGAEWRSKNKVDMIAYLIGKLK